ncbi:hypothetical protein ACW6QP_11950 [Salegentibacter sp. HM20]
MKRLIILLILMTIGCSADNENNESNIINPPAWLHGTWLVEGSTTGDNGVKFTSNDVILIQPIIDLSHRKLIQDSRDLGQEIEVIETISDVNYSLHLDFQNAPTVKLEFSKLSPNEITWDQVPNSILVKQ